MSGYTSGEPLDASGTTGPLDLNALRKRYTADEPKPCRVCGGPLSVQSMGGGRATEWACSDRPHRQEGDPNDLEWYEHYRQSKWTQFRCGDPEVLEALAEIERLRAEPAEARLNPGHEINLTCGHCRRCPATRVIVAFLPPPIGRNTEIVCGDCAEYGMEMISTICHTIQTYPVVFARPERRPTGVHR